MANSITPATDSPEQIDQGTTWFREYRWTVDGVPQDLTGWGIEVMFYDDNASPIFETLSIGSGVTLQTDPTIFEVKLSKIQTTDCPPSLGLRQRGEIHFKVYLTNNTGSLHAGSSYEDGECLTLVAASLTYKKRGSRP